MPRILDVISGPRRLGAAILAIVLTIGLFANTGQAQAVGDAGGFLVELTDRAVAQLTEPGLAEQEKERRFRSLVNENFDMKAIVRFVLGRYWRRASPEERASFQAIFEDLIVHRFLPLFAKYSGEKFRIGLVRPFRNDPNFLNVSSELRREKAEPIKVDWRVRRSADRFKIVDIVAEGVSIAVTLRSEYTSVLKQNGGSVGKLVSTLRAKIDKL